MNEQPMDWQAAKENFDAVMAAYTDLLGTPNVLVGPALMVTFEPLVRRYNGGERTRELYDEMMSVE